MVLRSMLCYVPCKPAAGNVCISHSQLYKIHVSDSPLKEVRDMYNRSINPRSPNGAAYKTGLHVVS